jgi:hypothetical protein
MTGFEPVITAWEAVVLPLHHIRVWSHAEDYNLANLDCQMGLNSWNLRKFWLNSHGLLELPLAEMGQEDAKSIENDQGSHG